MSYRILGIFFASLVLFTLGLSQQEIIGFESRFYLFALEMWRHGPSWFPLTYEQAYPDYPGTTTFFIYVLAKCVGHLNKLVAVLPSAIAASLTVVYTYKIGALRSERWGFYAACFLFLTNMFVMEARTISPDQFVAMVTTIAFYLVAAHDLGKKTSLVYLPFLLALGFACRGPIGLVVPAGVLCVHYLLEPNYRKVLRVGIMALIILLVMSALLFAVAYHTGGIAFVQDVLRMEVVGRMQDAHLPWYFYGVESLGAYALTYPLAILVFLGLWHREKSEDLRFLCQLVGWVLVILIGLSIPAGKKIRYLLAFAPALSLISAYLFVGKENSLYWKCLRKCVQAILIFLPLIMGFALYVILPMKNLGTMIYFYMAALVVLQVLSMSFRNRYAVVLGAAAVTFVLTTICIVEPINLKINATHDFVEQVEVLRHDEGALLAFYQEHADALPIKYMANMEVDVVPIFLEDQNSLLLLPESVFIITSYDHFFALPAWRTDKFHIVAIGNIGHEMVIVFQRKH